MRTIRITRQGFSRTGMCFFVSYLERCLGMNYNIVVDDDNPDIVIWSNLSFDNQPDVWISKKTGVPTPQRSRVPIDHPNLKFLCVSGELMDWESSISLPNKWAIGYAPISHPRYLQQASAAFDIWGIYDEMMLTDNPTDWLFGRDYSTILQRNIRFCSVVQNSSPPHRVTACAELDKYKTVDGAGIFRNNRTDSGVNRDGEQAIYAGRAEGIGYRQKLLFQSNYKFSIAMQLCCEPYCVQEKLPQAFFSGNIPIFWGNPRILEFGWNPNAFINLHTYESVVGDYRTIDWDAVRDRIRLIDTDESVRKQMIEEPIFVGNKLPEQLRMSRTAEFLRKMVEA